MYAVNFGDDNGFMIISADKESPLSLLALSDVGHFDYQKLDEKSPFYNWLDDKSKQISKKLEQKSDLSNERYGIWKDMNSTKETIIDVQLVGDKISIKKTKNGKGKLAKRHKNSWIDQSSWTKYNNNRKMWYDLVPQ